MKITQIKIGNRVAKEQGSMGYKVGTVKDVKSNLAFVDFDNHANKWVSLVNLEIVK